MRHLKHLVTGTSPATRARLLILAALLGVVAGLGRQYLKLRAQSVKVQAVGNLTFTFNGLPPQAPVFAVDDLKPGDCYTRDVVAQNDGQSPAAIGVSAENISNLDNLSSVLFLSVTQGANTLYGGSEDQKTLSQFFTDSTETLEGLPLSSLGPSQSTTYTFQVCMPHDAGNEWQKTQLIFDLLFGNNTGPTPTPTLTSTPSITPTSTTTPTPTPTPSIPVPPECAPIAADITHVFYGTEGDDDIHSGITNDLIITYGGDDWIDASGGHDCVVVEGGDKYIRTEDGNDIIVVKGDGTNTLISGSGDDIIYGGGGPDTIDSGTGVDYVYGGAGDDTVEAGDHDDHVWGGPGADVLEGETGNDWLYGEGGNDSLDGGSGDDWLEGGDDDDTLKGGSGTNHLDGGPGTDSLTGGSGTDTCIAGETLISCDL